MVYKNEIGLKLKKTSDWCTGAHLYMLMLKRKEHYTYVNIPVFLRPAHVHTHRLLSSYLVGLSVTRWRAQRSAECTCKRISDYKIPEWSPLPFLLHARRGKNERGRRSGDLVSGCRVIKSLRCDRRRHHWRLAALSSSCQGHARVSQRARGVKCKHCTKEKVKRYL